MLFELSVLRAENDSECFPMRIVSRGLLRMLPVPVSSVFVSADVPLACPAAPVGVSVGMFPELPAGLPSCKPSLFNMLFPVSCIVVRYCYVSDFQSRVPPGIVGFFDKVGYPVLVKP